MQGELLMPMRRTASTGAVSAHQGQPFEADGLIVGEPKSAAHLQNDGEAVAQLLVRREVVVLRMKFEQYNVGWMHVFSRV